MVFRHEVESDLMSARGPWLRLMIAGLMLALGAPVSYGLEISYAGRLTDSGGAPVKGPVSLTLNFYDAVSGGTAIVTRDFANIPLISGIFQVAVEIDSAAWTTLLGNGEKHLFVEVVALGKVYPRQPYPFVPLALRVPVDGTTVTYDTEGKLKIIVSSINTVSSVAGRTGAVSLSTDDVAEGSNASRQYFSSERARSALRGVSPLVYDSATGQLSLTNYRIRDLADPGSASDAATKGYVDSRLAGAPLDLSAAVDGKVLKWSEDRFVLSDDQSSVNGVGNLRGLVSPNQSLTVEATAAAMGVGPTWSSPDSSTHKLSIPMASGTGVGAGLISKADYDRFQGKQDLLAPASIVEVGAISTSLQSGVELLPYGSTAGNTGELRFIELTGEGNQYVGLKAPDTLGSSIIWTLPAAHGVNGQVLKTDGAGRLGWVSAPQLTASLASVAARTGAITLTTADVGEVSQYPYFSSIRARAALSASAPVTYASSSGSIGLQQASAAADGYLKATDFLAFQGKQSAGNYITALTGDGTASGPSGSGAATLTLADTGVTAGSYARVTVDRKGRVTGGSPTVGDGDIGAAAGIADTKLATIATVGKVANSATSATSSSGANTIVLRDSAGNFSAGTITASLNGIASQATTAESFTGQLSGDVSGLQSGTSVAKIRGMPVASTVPSGARQALLWDGASWAPGSVVTGELTWHTVTASSQTASVGHAYVTDRPSRVTITLPQTCSLGDRVKVVGLGAGGWALDAGARTLLGPAGPLLPSPVQSVHFGQIVDLVCVEVDSTWQIASLPPSQPPVFGAVPQQILDAATAYSLDLSAFAKDPNGNTLTYSMSCSATCPSGLAMNAATGVVSWTPTASQGGLYGITFSASNGVASSPQTTSLKVFGPTLALIPDQLIPIGAPFSYTLQGNSPIGATLTYSVSGAPSDMTFNTLSGVLSWTPSSLVYGQLISVTFSVSDGRVSATRVMKIYPGIVVCGGSLAENCYSGSGAQLAKNAGEAKTPNGKLLTWTANSVWVEKNGTKVLKADGMDAWSLKLSPNGRNYTANYMAYSASAIAGRACPTHVMTPTGTTDEVNLVTTNTCLYYDAGNGGQRLDAAGTSQTTLGSIGLAAWNLSSTGGGSAASWYEGNIQTCAAKGMRMPTIYETSANRINSSAFPNDASPSFPSPSGGVPAVTGGWTRSASAYTQSVFDTGAGQYRCGDSTCYWAWNPNTSYAAGNSWEYSNPYYNIRCVVP